MYEKLKKERDKIRRNYGIAMWTVGCVFGVIITLVLTRQYYLKDKEILIKMEECKNEK